MKSGYDWCYGNEGDGNDSLGTVIGTCEPGSGYDFKMKCDVNIIVSENLDYY